MSKRLGLIIVFAVLAISILLIAGCSEEKKEYTIDEPFDFGSQTNDSVESEIGSEVLATRPPKKEDVAATPDTGNENEGDDPVGNPANPTEAPSSGSNPDVPSQDSSQGVSGDVIDDKTFNDVAEENKVPDDVAQKMTTRALMETYMKYPMIKLLIFEADPMASYNAWLKSDDICVNQLMEREDAVAVIVEKYKALVQKEQKEHLTDEADMDLEFEIDWIELLLLQDQVKEKANLNQQKEILDLANKRDANVLTNGYAVTDLYPSLAEKYKLG